MNPAPGATKPRRKHPDAALSVTQGIVGDDARGVG